jgi:hypothetical protein
MSVYKKDEKKLFEWIIITENKIHDIEYNELHAENFYDFIFILRETLIL